MSEVTLDSAAQAEYDEALDWYTAYSPASGSRFVREFDRAVGLIRAFPAAHPRADGTHRFFRLRKFPYTVYYRPGDPVRIVAVASDGKPSGYWHGRP